MLRIELVREDLSPAEIGRILEALGEMAGLMDNGKLYKITVSIVEEKED